LLRGIPFADGEVSALSAKERVEIDLKLAEFIYPKLRCTAAKVETHATLNVVISTFGKGPSGSKTIELEQQPCADVKQIEDDGPLKKFDERHDSCPT